MVAATRVVPVSLTNVILGEEEEVVGITEDEEVDKVDEDEKEEELLDEEEEVDGVDDMRAAGKGVVGVGEDEGVCAEEVVCADDEVDGGVLVVEGGVLEGVVLGVAGGEVTAGGAEVVEGLGRSEGSVVVGTGVSVGDPGPGLEGLGMSTTPELVCALTRRSD